MATRLISFLVVLSLTFVVVASGLDLAATASGPTPQPAVAPQGVVDASTDSPPAEVAPPDGGENHQLSVVTSQATLPESVRAISANLLTNPGFENGSYSPSAAPTGWTRDAWQSGAGFTWDNTQSYGGSKSVKVEAITANDARWIQTVSVTPNTQYVLSGYIKTVNVAHTSQSQDAGANLSILGGYTSTPALFGTNGWKYVSVVFNSGSNTQVTVAARLGMYSGVTTGTAWFDDLQLEPVCYTLTKAANPSGGGSVSASPAPNCNGGTQYTINTVVTLTANANSGYSFSSWSGNASGAANPTTVTMNANKSVTANFAVSLPNLKPHKYPDWDYPLVPSSVSGTHAVNTLYAGDPTTRPTYLDWAVINDGSASTNRSYYVDVYFDGTLVKYWEITDNTTPGMSWYLHDWVLSVTTTPGPHTLRLVVDPTNLVQETNENDNTWSMTFNWINPSVPCYTLTKGVSPSGRGSVSANPAPNCNGGTQYTAGTLVTLTATPNGSYVFTSWTGDASGAANPTTVTMNGNKSVTANFAEPCYTLTKSANPSAGGSVTANPAPNCNGGTQYLPGTQVTLWATVNGNYTFTGWGGDASGAANPTTVTMNGHKSVTANFFAQPATP